MSIQDRELQKQQYLEEMQRIINQIQIKDYRNERIDIHYRRECEIKVDELKDPEDSLIMGNEELSTIPEKESNKLIKSSVEDYVPNPSEFEDTSGSDSECDLPLCDDFSPINIPKGKSMIFSNPLFDSNDNFTSSDDKSLSDKDVPKNKVKIYSNPFFKFDDEYISSNVNSLFDEDECFNPGSDVDEIELLLHRDPSTPKISVASILEGFTDEPPLEENDDSKIQYLNDNQARFAA
ncbi:hypothetical protein Tco_0888867 [Tanacetum coccineum]